MPGLQSLGVGTVPASFRGGFSPTSLSSLFAWYNADSSNVTLVSGNVAQWNDSSGNGHHLVQSSSLLRPSFVSSGGVGGGPSLLFDGLLTYLQNEESSSIWKFLSDGTGFTVAFAVKLITGSTLNTVASTCRIADLDQTGASIGLYNTTINQYAIQIMGGNIGSRVINAEPSADTSGSQVAYFSYLEGASPEYTVRKNGVSLQTGSSTINPSSSNPSYALRVGVNGTNQFLLNGYLRELVICNSVLSATDRTSLETYLATLI